MGDVHEIAMNIMISLILLHAIAALLHQYVLKDGTLLKMLGQKYDLYKHKSRETFQSNCSGQVKLATAL